MSASAHERARAHALALIVVAVVFAAKRACLKDVAGTTAFLPFDAAVVATALVAGVAPALTATAASALLAFRELADREISTLSAVLLFAAQAAAIAGVVLWLQRDRLRLRRSCDVGEQELERTRAGIRALERQHAAWTREMSDRHERLRAESTAEREAVLGQLDATAGQLQRVELLTDPALSELPTGPLLDELLRRLHATLGADTAVLVDARRPAEPAIFGPSAGAVAVRRDRLTTYLTSGVPSARVHLVQNDPARLAETSVIAWRDQVATLVSVRVVCAGISLGVIEIAMKRARRWTDWDTALLRVVADRAAWVLTSGAANPTRAFTAAHPRM
jgi:hypothetical protein